MFDTCNADNIIKISAQQAYIKYLELFIWNKYDIQNVKCDLIIKNLSF